MNTPTLLPKVPGLFALDDRYLDPLEVVCIGLREYNEQTNLGTLFVYIGQPVVLPSGQGAGASLAATGGANFESESFSKPWAFEFKSRAHMYEIQMKHITSEMFAQLARDLAEAKCCARGMTMPTA
jgi:hypothetical protein